VDLNILLITKMVVLSIKWITWPVSQVGYGYSGPSSASLFNLYHAFAGGLLALGSDGSSDPTKYLKLGADITHTCHESYDRSGGFAFYIILLNSNILSLMQLPSWDLRLSGLTPTPMPNQSARMKNTTSFALKL
jgi:hypothetical protein